MESIFKDFSEKILVYLSVSINEDPYEKNTSEILQNSIPIRAIVSDYTFSKIQWAMPGIVTDKAKEITVEYKHKALLEQSQRLSIDGDNYVGWKVNGKLQYRKEGAYLRLLCYSEKS